MFALDGDPLAISSALEGGIRSTSPDDSSSAAPDDGSQANKRKLDAEELKPVITILPYKTLPNHDPWELSPKRWIPRDQLPLASLAHGGEVFPLFQADSANNSYLPCDGEVLIAEVLNIGSTCVVERAFHNVFALYPLDRRSILPSWKLSHEEPPLKKRCLMEALKNPNNVWWKRAAIDAQPWGNISTKGGSNYRAQLSVKLPMSYDTYSRCHGTLRQESPPEPGTPTRAASEAPSIETVNTGDLVAAVRLQYLDLLYIHKSSLAYYAKGALSRVRAMLQRLQCDTEQAQEVISFMRASVLSLGASDQKYTTTLPALIEKVPLLADGDDENPQYRGAFGSMLRKSKKRKKISKEGLLPGEEEYVLRWWLLKNTTQDRGHSADTEAQRIEACLIGHRVRETYLQVILILEILAWETQSRQAVASSTIDEGPVQRAATKKSKELETLLDVLIDRLCIWQSMTLEGKLGNSAHDSANANIPPKRDDGLQSFCSEVILPFYAARLPQLYQSLCRKMGEHGVPSPMRPRLPKRRQPALKSKENIELTATRPALARAPTEGVMKQRKGRTVLTRSATESAVPDIKCEAEKIPMATIPPSRGRLQDSKRYTQREVDLTAMTQAPLSNSQRKAAIERELREAIDTLKRPNARVAVRALVASADRRALQTSKKARPTRYPLVPNVQILATPKIQRTRDIYQHGGIPASDTSPRLPNPRVPSSTRPQTSFSNPRSLPLNCRISSSNVPRNASSTRPRGPSPDLPWIPASSPPARALIQESDLQAYTGKQTECYSAESPLRLDKTQKRHADRANFPGIPIIHRNTNDTCSSPPPLATILDTDFLTLTTNEPSSTSIKTPIDVPQRCRHSTPPIGESIYDVLGWNDEPDEAFA